MGRHTGIAKYKTTRAYGSLHEPLLRPAEQTVYDMLRAEGWRVLKGGWPDFLAERGGSIRFIEVKNSNDRVGVAQKRILRSLRRIGIEVEVVKLGENGECPNKFIADSPGIPTRAEEYRQALIQIARISDDPEIVRITRKALRGGPQSCQNL